MRTIQSPTVELDANGNHVVVMRSIEVPDITVEETNADLLRSKVATALATNATFLAIATPTAAQITAQVQRLTRECSAVIRLLVVQLDDTTGT